MRSADIRASIVVFITLLALPLPLSAQERVLRAEALGDGVHVVVSSNLGDPNVLIVEGSDELLLVDGTFGDAMDELLEVVRATSDLPIGNVVLTHWHPDHTQGNATFRSQGATLWAHENAQHRMHSGNAIDYFGLQVPAYPEEALADSIITGSRTIDLGEREIHVIPLDPAHTDGDVLVHLPRANVLHVGDLQLAGVYPFVELSSGGDVEGLMAALDQAIELMDENTVVIPGHGPLGDRADLQAYRSLLATVWPRVEDAVTAGSSLEETITLRPAREFEAQWSTPLIPTDRFIGILYEAASDDDPAPADASARPLGAETDATRATDGVSPSPVVAALMADIETLEGKLVGLAQAMPAEIYDWRPAEGVRSVREVLLHVAADNYFIPTFAGASIPAETGLEPSFASVQAYEARDVDRETAIAELRASFDHLARVMRGLDDAALAQTLDVFGQRMSGLELWVLATTHLHEHLGQSIAYARSNDVVPPWSRPSD